MPQRALAAVLRGIVSTMHLRMPSIDRGVQSFLWSVLFFLVLYFGMLAVGVAEGNVVYRLARQRVPDLPVRPHARRLVPVSERARGAGCVRSGS